MLRALALALVLALAAGCAGAPLGPNPGVPTLLADREADAAKWCPHGIAWQRWHSDPVGLPLFVHPEIRFQCAEAPATPTPSVVAAPASPAAPAR